MTRQQIENEIRILNKKIASLEEDNRNSKKSIREAENCSNWVLRFSGMFEEYITTQFGMSKKHASTLSEGNTFGQKYLEELKTILGGQEANEIQSLVFNTKRKTVDDIDRFEKRISKNNRNISLYKQKIKQYKQQLMQMP